eukprot:238759-Amphidinium_carterae.1
MHAASVARSHLLEGSSWKVHPKLRISSSDALACATCHLYTASAALKHIHMRAFVPELTAIDYTREFAYAACSRKTDRLALAYCVVGDDVCHHGLRSQEQRAILNSLKVQFRTQQAAVVVLDDWKGCGLGSWMVMQPYDCHGSELLVMRRILAWL